MTEIDRKQQMLVEGRRLFLTNGYTATSIDAICEAAGVTKGAFFHYFKSKDDFASEVLHFTWSPVEAEHHTLDSSDARQRLAEHIAFMARWVWETGRLMTVMAQELASSNPEIRSQIGGYFAAWMGYLDTLLAAAVDEAESAVETESLKEFIVATTEGIPVVASQFGPQAVDHVIGHLTDAVVAALDR